MRLFTVNCVLSGAKNAAKLKINKLYHRCKMFTVEDKIFKFLYYIVITKYSYFIITISRLILFTYLSLNCSCYLFIALIPSESME